MIELNINGIDYKIEFRHVTKMGKRRQLFERAPVRAVTTCVVSSAKFIAIDNAICSNEDNFSRRQGRIKALEKVLKHCGALKDVSKTLMDHYLSVVDPAPAAVAIRRTALSEQDRQALIEKGEQKRNERRVLRAG